ncbi:MAG: hypothetical protein HZA46_20525 [Planctomycetales bacterium]|nr:hypothetical protein [Planctomycetales bacterium]
MRTHRRARLRFWFGWFVASLLVAMVAGLEAQQTPRSEPSEATDGILVMKNGGVVRGRILPSGSTYIVKQSHGEMVVPADLVHGAYSDLGDAYTQRKAEWPQATAERHLSLARWCVTQNMLDEARVELKSALALEPTRDDIRGMLQRLNTLTQPTSPSSSVWETSPKSSKSPLPTVSVFEDAESLGGFSREAALQFTRKVQPILMNNCTLAACHGPESKVSDFQLQPVHVGGHTTRLTAERNLAEVLKYISTDRPSQSLLVTKPVGNHGVRGRPVFQGTRGADQLREIKKWVEIVAADGAGLARDPQRDQRTSTANPSPSQAMIPSELDSTESPRTAKPRSSRPRINPRPGSPITIPPVDEFDPDIFNRRHHGVAKP